MLLFRVIGFSGGDPYQLQSAERKHNNAHHHQPGPAMRQKAALFPTGCARYLRPAVSLKSKIHAPNRIIAMTAITFNIGEPKLHLTEHFNVGQADGVDNEGRRRSPCGDPPDRTDILPLQSVPPGGNQYVQHPVVPAGSESGKAAPVFIGEVAKSIGDRFFNHHSPAGA